MMWWSKKNDEDEITSHWLRILEHLLQERRQVTVYFSESTAYAGTVHRNELGWHLIDKKHGSLYFLPSDVFMVYVPLEKNSLIPEVLQ